jgi:hypothetical protein
MGGQIEVRIRGLVLGAGAGAAAGTVGPVTAVAASLVCGDVVAATTKEAPLSTAGDARIEDSITIPSPCIAPALLVRIAETTTGPSTAMPFIAVNAIAAGAPNGDDSHD